MNAIGPERSLALVLSKLGGQARARLIEGLPAKCRDGVFTNLEDVERLDRSEMSFVEQVLSQELDRLSADNPETGDTFREYYSLRVANVLTLVLLKGTPDHAASFLSHIPHSIQAECVHAIAAQDWNALENHMGADERELLVSLDAWLGGEPRQPRLEMAVAVLASINTPRQLRALLTHIHLKDSEVAKNILADLFSIEDLRRLTDRELQTLTTGIDDWDLAVAILAMSSGLRGRILSNVSRRRAAFLKDDVVYLEDTDEEEIQSVCDRILLRARMLYEEGRLQTYLGSVSAQPDDEEEQEETARKRSKSADSAPVEEDPHRRSYRAVVFGLAGLALVAGAWYLGIGSSRPRPTGSRAKTTVTDFSTRKRSEAGGNATVAGNIVVGGESSGLTATDGDVYVVSGTERRPVEDTQILRGDVVETGEDSRALISLKEDEAQIEVEEESSIQLGERDVSTGPPKLSLRVGNVWVLVKNPALEVHSPLAVVTASVGALFRFRVVLSSATTISVEHGTAWVQPNVGTKELVVLGEGKSLRIDPRGPVDLPDIDFIPNADGYVCALFLLCCF